ITQVNSLVNTFSLEYNNRVKEIVQQASSNYPYTFNPQQLEELEQIKLSLVLFIFMKAKARNICVEKAIELKDKAVEEIVDRELERQEKDPNYKITYTLKDLNYVKDHLNQIKHHVEIGKFQTKKFMTTYTELLEKHQYETRQHEQKHHLSSTVTEQKDYCSLCYTPPLQLAEYFKLFWIWYTSYSAKFYLSKTIEYTDKLVTELWGEERTNILTAITNLIFSIVYSKISRRFQEIPTSISALTNTLQPFTSTSGTTLPLTSSNTTESNMTLTGDQLKELLKKVTDGFKETAQSIKSETHRSFEPLFLKRFTTLENKNKWHYELYNIRQEQNKRVDKYSARFKRLLAKVDPAKVLPEEYTTRIYISGLKEEIVMLIVLENTNILADAMKNVVKVE
ncbi:26535_t:CDS:2, partial [Dentiscutata erythropus]